MEICSVTIDINQTFTTDTGIAVCIELILQVLVLIQNYFQIISTDTAVLNYFQNKSTGNVVLNYFQNKSIDLLPKYWY
jgi:hypothetical protein